MPAKRCPMCRRVNPDSAQRCDCGYGFGQDIRVVVADLRTQERRAWLILLAGIAVLALLVGVVVLSVVVSGGARLLIPLTALGSFGAIGYAVRTIVVSRRSARELTERMKLPAARVIDR